MNPMAAELCRVGLWLEALEPGKPLSFIDHHVRVGNSLLGATPELIAAGLPDGAFNAIEGDDKKACTVLKNRNKAERKGLGPLFAQQDAETQARLQQAAAVLEELPDDRPEEIRVKELTFRRHEQTEEYLHKKDLADTWCAAFFMRKHFREAGHENSATGITQGHLNGVADGRGLPRDLAAEVARLSERYKFFHWHLAFPEVFARGGFDVIVGNPPWGMTEDDSRTEEKIDLQLDTGGEASRDGTRVKRERSFFARAGRFPLSAQNRLQLARLFAELFGTIRASGGAAGMIVPSTLTVNAFDRPLWTSWVRSRAVSCVWDFVNFDLLFSEVYWRQKFAIICLQSRQETFRARCWMTDPSQLMTEEDHVVVLSESDLFRYSGPELALPHFRGRLDLALLASAISAFGRVSDSKDWAAEYVLLGATNDQDFVRERRRASSATEESADHSALPGWIPVYEGKMVGLFDHRFARVVWKAGNVKRRAQAEALTKSDKANPEMRATPLWEVPSSLVAARDPSVAGRGWDIALCDVTSALNERTTIAAVVPFCFATHNLPLVRVCGGDPRSSLLFLATLASFVLDYFARLRIATNHLTEGIFASLPMPSPKQIRAISATCFADEWGITRRALELSYTAWDLRPLARDYGWTGGPFRWDDERRFLLRCELDAAFFRLYLPADANGEWCRENEPAEDLVRLSANFSTPRDAVSYIMDSFSIVRRRDEERYDGDYRTKRVILEIYDAFAEASSTGQPYQTCLDPPPGDIRCCHAPRKVTLLDMVASE
jgi:hypothetical protein